MAALQLLWDIMLVGTMLYYHRMIEKVISGIVAILTWYFTYRFWYPTNGLLPEAPGNGSFYYQRENFSFKRPTHLASCSGPAGVQMPATGTRGNSNGKSGIQSQQQQQQQIPTFMGMPLFTNVKAASAAASLQQSAQQSRDYQQASVDI